MRELTHTQITEFFHVAFLDVLSRRLDPWHYVLKGGVNLRYFYGSPRYSEDIDLDLLLRRRTLPDGALDSATCGEAADRALQLPFAAFRDQVLPFIEPDAVELYDSEASWEQMQTFVSETLEATR